MSPFAIVYSLIKFALCIGLAGGLVDATISLGRKEEEAKAISFVSLKALNDSLYTNPKAK